MSSFFKRVEMYPPIFCRLMARHPRGAALTTEEIAERSGLHIYRVLVLSERLSWQEVPVLDLKAFTQACGMDFSNRQQMRRVSAYAHALSKGKIGRKFAWLTRDPNYLHYFLPLRKRWYESRYPSPGTVSPN